jgi:signal transduction histidine kinase/CheY-like chemotaxis protein
VDTITAILDRVSATVPNATPATPVDYSAAIRAELRDARALAFRQATEMQSLRERAAVATHRVEEVLSRRLEFASRVSHEIRSPLNAILGYADLLLEATSEVTVAGPGVPPTTTAEAGVSRKAVDAGSVEGGPVAPHETTSLVPWLRVIQRNAEQLLTVVEDIVELARLEAGRSELETEDVFPTREVFELVDRLGPRARQKRLPVDIRHQGPIPERIRTDRGKLQRVLTNLLGNAIKYTDRGKIVVTISMAGSPWDESPRLKFAVEDTGMGISREWLGHLFESPLSASVPEARQSAGTGLGLAVSWHLARLLGGDLTVDSELGRGSTFTFTVGTGRLDQVRMVGHLGPESEDEARPPVRVQAPTHGPTLQAKVLVVEDGIDNQRLLKMILARAGAVVEIAENGRVGVDRALAALRGGRPFDVILMDMQMPELDGYGATRELRTQGVSQPILALTAHAMSGDRDLCLAAGCDDYLTKPVDRDILLQTLCRWLDEARKVGGAA